METYNHLFITPQWMKEYYSKYPQGLSVMENLIDWVTLVNQLIDHVNMTPDKIEEVLIGWRDDGTLDEIISEALLNLHEVSITRYQSLFVGSDVTAALKQAIIDAPAGSKIKFNPAVTYELTDTIILSKPVTIDFNSAPVKIKMNGKVAFELQHSGEINYNNRIKLLNYAFRAAEGFIPSSIIYINGAINSVLLGSFDDCIASHSLIWNYKGYHTTILGEARWSDCPRVIYLSSSSGSIHSFAFDINIDITGNTGKGIETEGANGQIRGVIESCAGAYEFNGVHNATGINVSVHFENNTLFDMKIGAALYVPAGSTNSGIHNLIGSLFSRTINKSILYGSGQMISVFGCQLYATLEPIDDTVVGTTINSLGNLGVYDEVLPAELLKLKFSLNQWGEYKNKKLTTNSLNVLSPDGSVWQLVVSDLGVITPTKII